jgi:puromycin-sensitive aminopeptidase
MKMATYIVAFVVGQFDRSEAIEVDGIPFSIYAPVGKLNLTPFALEIGASALSFFNKYYGIKYPGDKMDMIAVPDFAFGAMENLGCVIYRENALLVDPLKASQAEKERVADVVAHELAHMWFGNLTTMKWWNGIWLNEAFATFMALVAVDAWKPQWKRFETFGVSRAMAFATDGLAATRAIEYPVSRPEEANGMFDILTYEKGASVLRMLEQYIGEDKFKAGVNAYLNKHKFANTETCDLWESLAEASGEPVEEIMNSWIFQEGHPLVSVALSEDKKSLHLSQKRFYYLPEHGKNIQLFQIPLLLKIKVKTAIDKREPGERLLEQRILLSTEEMKVSLDGNGGIGSGDDGAGGDSTIEWVLANAGGHGFYRVEYSS